MGEEGRVSTATLKRPPGEPGRSGAHTRRANKHKLLEPHRRAQVCVVGGSGVYAVWLGIETPFPLKGDT